MFKKILIANRGDQPHSGAAPKPLVAEAHRMARAAPKPLVAEAHRMARAACTGGFAAEVAHV